MIRALRTAATGMFAQEMQIDTISNNLANVNTTGYKKAKIEFQDLLYQNRRAIGVANIQGVNTPTEIQIGHGTAAVSVQKSFSQGDINVTENPLDLAIDGNGFFQLLRNDGTIAYTRDGSFKLAADGRIINSDGLVLEPEATLPADTQSVRIAKDGVISVLTAGETEAIEIGRIEFARFINPAGLENLCANLYKATEAAGEPIIGSPGAENFGTVRQGNLEMSNVQVVEEMINMIIAQRAYEINSKAIRTSEDMLNIASNLRR
ncbi:MAG: flagellar basal-body rod protein FlgG [Calditrichaeota bacterium]|nr:MAG: flagellar basal-body rod protein FlgG [Calditrichota bacterium]